MCEVPLVPLGQGLSTSIPLCVWGHNISLFFVLSQNLSGKGKESIGATVSGALGGDLGPLLPSFGPDAVVVFSKPFWGVAVVVVVVVVFRGSNVAAVSEKLCTGNDDKVTVYYCSCDHTGHSSSPMNETQRERERQREAAVSYITLAISF